MSIRKRGSPTCSPACRITRPSAFTNCCPGTGTGKTLLLKLREAPRPPLQTDPPVALTGCVRCGLLDFIPFIVLCECGLVGDRARNYRRGDPRTCPSPK